jgi:hypothetical protein
MARRSGRHGDPRQPGQHDPGDAGDELSAAVVESLLQDGYAVEEIGALYGLTARRVRRFLRRHGLQEPAATQPDYEPDAIDRGYPASRGEQVDDHFGDPWGIGTPPSLVRSGPDRRRPRHLTTAQIDELCSLYLDPSLSVTEVASYFDLDADVALELINQHLTGIVPHQEP